MQGGDLQNGSVVAAPADGPAPAGAPPVAPAAGEAAAGDAPAVVPAAGDAAAGDAAAVVPAAGDAAAGDAAAVAVQPVPAAIQPAAEQKPTLLERIGKAVENLVVLRVTTVIGTVSATGADQFDQITGLNLAPEGQQVSCTSINMLLGDCSLILSPNFVDNPAYKQLHDDSVKQALDVREQTIDLLKQAFEAFKDKLFP